ncbi:uncharacterized protein ACIBXB_020752 [Morphnus guianensis]
MAFMEQIFLDEVECVFFLLMGALIKTTAPSHLIPGSCYSPHRAQAQSVSLGIRWPRCHPTGALSHTAVTTLGTWTRRPEGSWSKMSGLCPISTSAFRRNGEAEYGGVCVQLRVMAQVGSQRGRKAMPRYLRCPGPWVEKAVT